jgi:putative endonuclease
MRDYCFAVYILASKKYGTLYTGVTGNLVTRVIQHQQGLIPGFTKKYGVKTLVWYEYHGDIEAAILRETQIKRWKRDWKISMIERENPHWCDLYPALVAPTKNVKPIVVDSSILNI